jgi:hypothetical protein
MGGTISERQGECTSRESGPPPIHVGVKSRVILVFIVLLANVHTLLEFVVWGA